MINVDCYNCGSNQRESYASENGFNLVKCSNCGLLYVTPRPTQQEIDEANKSSIYKGKSPLRITGEFRESKVKTYLRILTELYGTQLMNSKKTWLDIGCGCGEFIKSLHEFSRGNVIASGLEPNIQKQETARARGLDVSYFNLKNHDKQYDYISLLNVFSHLPNPPEFILQCKAILQPGGELLLETGDTANIPADEHYRPFQLPYEMSFASEDIVSDILRRCGFKIITIKKYPAFPFEVGTIKIIKELVKVFWPNKQSQIRELFDRYKKSRKFITDMYIRAAITR